MLSYALKRVTRSTWLFAALLLSVVLASTFFAGINVGADTTAKITLDQQLEQLVLDFTASTSFMGPFTSSIPLSSANWTAASEKLNSVEDVVGSEVVTRVTSEMDSNQSDFRPFTVVGVSDGSKVYDGLTVVSGASSLQANETYVWTGDPNAEDIELNDVIPFKLQTRGSHPLTIHLNLTVVGFVDLDEDALALASGHYSKRMVYSSSGISFEAEDIPWNIVITDWEQTFAGLIDTVYSMNRDDPPFETEILGYINREPVVNSWNVDESINALERMVLQLDNKLAEFALSTDFDLQDTLSSYRSLSMNMRMNFLAVAIPVFFVAWYVGSTVSNVSFNLRRREIGLLSAKGFSSRQLFSLFLSESLLIGIVGGLIGVALSYVLSPFFVPNLGTEIGEVPLVLTHELVILVLVFSTALSLLSTFLHSRRSAKLSTTDALREHMYVEEITAYKQKLPMAALFFGSYKIGMYLVGIPSLLEYFGGRPPMPSNIVLSILFGIWLLIDSGLVIFGPLLFFWGFMKIFVRGSKGFQKLASVFSRFLGDFGALATKNMKRNPVRAASVAFLVGLVIGYGFLTVGTLASEEDYIVRQVTAYVGADIKVLVPRDGNVSAVVNNITSLQGVESTTVFCSFRGTVGTILFNMRAVETQEWLETAYYEDEWFSGRSIAESFQELETDNNTIILARGVADTLGLQLNDYLTVTAGNTTTKLRVVGFHGLASTRPIQSTSYVSYNYYNSSGASASPHVLVKLEPEVNGSLIAEQIRDFESDSISSVSSVSERLANREIDFALSGRINVQRVGVIFTVVAASVGTALVALVSLQERKKEVAIMSIRGLSFKQVITMLLAESLSVLIFSAVVGCVIGVIITYGNTFAYTAETAGSLVSHRLVFPLDSILVLVVCIVLVFVSTILPILIVTRRYISNLERIVRS